MIPLRAEIWNEMIKNPSFESNMNRGALFGNVQRMIREGLELDEKENMTGRTESILEEFLKVFPEIKFPPQPWKIFYKTWSDSRIKAAEKRTNILVEAEKVAKLTTYQPKEVWDPYRQKFFRKPRVNV